MSTLYEISAATYLQMVESSINVLDKGAAHFAAQGQPADDMVHKRLHDEMADFHFQVVCISHHSLGALKGLQSGEFRPPSGYPEMDYAGLQAFLADTLEELQNFTPADINGLAGGKLTFKLSEREIPFTNENFILTFSLPNLYFHATTAYDLLRAEGVPLGKMDYLGRLRAGV